MSEFILHHAPQIERQVSEEVRISASLRYFIPFPLKSASKKQLVNLVLIVSSKKIKASETQVKTKETHI